MEPFDKRGDFEQAISLAFDGAEIVPEPYVWDRIDSSLAKDQNSSYRKRLLFFQLVAAASLVFAASVSLFQIFKTTDNPEIGLDKPAETSVPEQKDQSEIRTLAETTEITDETVNNEAALEDIAGKPLKEANEAMPNIAKIGFPENTTEAASEQVTGQADLVYEEGSIISPVGVDLEPVGYQIVAELKSYEPLMVPIWTKYKVENKEAMWASAGFAAGSYNTSAGGFNLGSVAVEAASYDPQDLQDSKGVFSDQQGGRSIGGGIGLGGKVHERWLLESGLNYLHSEIDGTTNSYIESDGNNYPLFYESRFAGAIQNTSSYDVTSSLDFISIPFKAGYVILDKKVGWVATTGVGSNILVGNSLSADLGQLEEVNYSVEDSPYRRLSWTGIIGTEVYFNITEDYQLVFVPQYNFGISEITKQESSFSIVPNSFNMGIRLRYLLK